MGAAEVYNIADSADPKGEMLKKIGDLSKVEVGGGRVLLWNYIAPRRTAGGIILTDKAVKEDIWQGVVGYVLKVGPLAFQDDAEARINFGGFKASVGDWVVFAPNEAKRRQINGVDCRLIEDALIEMKIADPTIMTHKT